MLPDGVSFVSILLHSWTFVLNLNAAIAQGIGVAHKGTKAPSPLNLFVPHLCDLVPSCANFAVRLFPDIP